MTKLEKLKAEAEAAWANVGGAYAAACAAYAAEQEILCVSARRGGRSYAWAAWVAYQEELKKQENSDDH
jgi:hypothetical protein